MYSQNRPLSADFAQPARKSSMLYSMLSSVVQSRLPRIPSLRRSVSLHGISTAPKSPGLTSGAPTSELGYTSAVVLSGPTTIARGNDGVQLDRYSVDSISSDEDSSQTVNETRQPMQLSEESNFGIGWKFANQGLNLLSLAVEESSTISKDPRFGNASFARQLYIHSLTYLLRALPPDLTVEEQLSIRNTLPNSVVEPLRLEMDPSYLQPGPNSSLRNEPSLLHRILASTIIQLFIFVQFIIPYIKYLLNAAYQYDREHKISEKVLSQGIETADVIGRHGMVVTGVIFGMGEGKVGQVLTDAVGWVVEGVTGGIHEGVGEGMALMGKRRERL